MVMVMMMIIRVLLALQLLLVTVVNAHGNVIVRDEEWMSSVHQYSRSTVTQRFRDEVKDDHIRTLESPQGSDESVDDTKDPCEKVRCSRHKVCVAQGYQRAMCMNRKKLEHKIKQSGLKLHANNCKLCPEASAGPVCGSDGHSYVSQCKLDQQACLSGKGVSVLCSGPCPCISDKIKTKSDTSSQPKPDACTGQDLADLGDRLRDWFQLLHANSKQKITVSRGFDASLVAGCKDSIGWMFSKLDTSNDLFLDQSELAAINLEKYEVCIRAFFNSCDSFRDGRVSTAEWCLCFWREKPSCLAEIERIQIHGAYKMKPGMFIPSCDEDGYYRKLQCDHSRGECWCVDPHGTEAIGSRIHGNPDCDELMSSGDFSSGVGWEDEEEKEIEENEEEEEAEESDDGGYIW